MAINDYPFPLNAYSNSLNVYTTDHTSAGYVGYYPQPFQLTSPSPPTWVPPNPWPVYIATEPQEEKEPMRGLFQVYIVDPENGEVMGGGVRIAKDEASARLKALKDPLCVVDKDLDEYDIIVVRLGDVRSKKSIQEVKVIP